MSLLREKNLNSLHEVKQGEIFTQWVKTWPSENQQFF